MSRHAEGHCPGRRQLAFTIASSEVPGGTAAQPERQAFAPVARYAGDIPILVRADHLRENRGPTVISRFEGMNGT